MRHAAAMLVLTVLVPGVTAGPPPTAGELVSRSIGYHDPNGAWRDAELVLRVVTTYSDELAARRGSATREQTLRLAPGRGRFEYRSAAGGEPLVVTIDGEVERVTLGGREAIDEATRERLRIRPAAFYRDYYEYLYGMPMKLRDPGTRIDPEIRRVTFEGREANAVRVTYDPEIGSDIWTFFFDVETNAIVGYRFQKDEAGTVGETIVLGGELVDAASGFRIPATQAWYVLADGEYLATDEIVSFEVRVP